MKPTILLIGAVILLMVVAYSSADPINATSLIEGAGSRANLDNTLKNVSAQAGNVTELNISSISITKAWQGYYGTISAEIVLADSSNNQFYNWSIATPAGEVYASPNSSVAWANVSCFNYTAPGGSAINVTVEQDWYNISTSAADGINETFNLTDHAEFTVGANTISANTCPSTYVFTDSGYQQTSFSNVLLTDNSSLLFTTLLENDVTGFDSGSYDFELLVAEDGHGSEASATTEYFFWVEIT